MMRAPTRGAAFLALTTLAAGCSQRDDGAWQGYVEGEYVFVAAPLPGELTKLSVARGAEVEQGAPLFELDDTVEKAALDEAVQRVDRAQATLADLKKGQRPSEIAALEAQLGQARAAQKLSVADLERVAQLAPKGGVSAAELDRARATRERDDQRVVQLDADVVTARLGSREDRIAAAEAELKTQEAARVRAAWDHDQKRQAAPASGLVFDTLFREGEWVEAGRPVVVLLPPANVKVRAFVPETRIGAVRIGDRAQIHVDGVAQPFEGRITFVSPEAEFTPPVIYSRDSRAKLVFMIEARFEPAIGAQLHPGQPVDLRIAKP